MRASVFILTFFLLFYPNISGFAQGAPSIDKNLSFFHTSTPIDLPQKGTLQNEYKNNWLRINDNIAYMRLFKYLPTDSELSQLPPQNISIDILKFRTANYNFSVYSANIDNIIDSVATPLPIEEWIKQKQLISAINASMFLPDGITSNGYLRKNGIYNNKHIGKRLGAFFLADPKNSHSDDGKILPKATILYKDEKNLSRFGDNKNISIEDLLNSYNVVVQNFKLFDAIDDTIGDAIDTDKTPSPEPSRLTKSTENLKGDQWTSQRQHSITAIAEDKDGNILFLHAEQALTIQQFAEVVKNSQELNLCRALYTEGGGQATMGLELDDYKKYWLGQGSFLLFMTGNQNLPNVIGVTE